MAISLYTVLIVAIFVAALDNCSATKVEKEVKDLQKELMPALQACMKEHGVSFLYLTMFMAQKKLPDDSKKCFFACVFKKAGVINNEGLYSEDVALQMISQFAKESQQDKAKQAAKACNSVNEQAVSDGVSGCNRTMIIFKCVNEHIKLFK